MTDDTKYLAIPWKEKGRDYKGCDCWGLVRLFLKDDCGLDLASLDGDYTHCRNIGEIRRLVQERKKDWTLIEPPEADRGDVVELSLSPRDYHVGIMISPRMVLHIEEGDWPTIQSISGKRIKGRLRGIWRYAGAC